ncbi:MAG: hypothetical protein LJE95_11995 [Acidobacteria bacterium]|nr:hypothetical protein [Acidobacteriota bacterium]
MTRIRLFVAAVAVGVALSTAVPAAAGGEGPPIPALDHRISLELRDAVPQKVFETFGKLLASPGKGSPAGPVVHVKVKPGIEGKLTICLRDVTVRTTLRAICESLECSLTWRRDGDDYLLVVSPAKDAAARKETNHEQPASLDQPVDLKLEGAKLTSVLRTVGGITNRKVLIDEALDDRVVSLTVKETPVREVLDRLCSQAGCTWAETKLGVLTFSPR